MRIYVDFDDVLCETARPLSDLARTLFARQVPYEAIGVFDLQQAFSLSDAEIARLMDRAHEPDFLTGLEPTPGSLEAMRMLHALGHDLVIVTGRPASSHAGSMGWLRKFGLEHTDLLYVDKYGRSDRHPQVAFPKTLNLTEFNQLHFDVAIDDSPTALDLLTHRSDCTVIVFDRPWNRQYTAASPMRRYGAWPEIVRLIKTLG